MASPEIDRLIQQLSKLPGLGPRSSRRVALYLLKRRAAVLDPLVAALATAASTALPPCIKICSPAIAARGWLVATIPFLAWTVERRESKNIFGGS